MLSPNQRRTFMNNTQPNTNMRAPLLRDAMFHSGDIIRRMARDIADIADTNMERTCLVTDLIAMGWSASQVTRHGDKAARSAADLVTSPIRALSNEIPVASQQEPKLAAPAASDVSTRWQNDLWNVMRRNESCIDRVDIAISELASQTRQMRDFNARNYQLLTKLLQLPV
jgi:hypothetical protein